MAGYYTQPVGGVETYIREIIPRLRSTGAEVGLLTLSQGNPVSGGLASADVPWLDGSGLTSQTITNRIANWGPDVVFSHGLGNPDLEATIAAKFSSVYFAHNYGGTCVSGTKTHAAPVVSPCGRPIGLACLALYIPRRCGGWNPATAIRMYRQEMLRLRAIGRCRAVLVASKHMAAELARNGLPPDRIHLAPLFPMGTAPDPLPPASKLRTHRVLSVGRLTALKGWPQLLDALHLAATKLDRRLTLIVAGDGPDRAAFEAEAKRQGVPTEFLGWIGPEQRNREMRAADLLAVPSVWPEPFGLVGIEAGCVGLPAVGFAVGGIPDWLIPGVSGELAPGDRPNSQDLANAIVRALSNDEHLSRLRVGAWETARRFTPEAHMAALLPILDAASRK